MARQVLVNILKAFTLSLVREGQAVVVAVEAGVQRLEEDIANHWYTKAHAGDVPKGVKQSDAEAAEEARKAAEAEQKAADDAELARMEAEEKAAADAKAKADAEAAASDKK